MVVSGSVVMTTMEKTTTSTTTMTMVALMMMTVIIRKLPLVSGACKTTELIASPAFGYISYSNSDKDSCTWVIRATSKTEVIALRITDWYTNTGFVCTRNRLIVRDGPEPTSPYLRVICGVTCGTVDNVTEVVSSSNAVRVSYVSYELTSSTSSSGFSLCYRTRNISPVVHQEVMYTSVNYLLMCASVLVIGGLMTGVLFLFYRELGMKRRQHHQHMMDVLSRRRQGFSGQSGVPSRVGSSGSNDITADYINNIRNADEGNYIGGGDGGGGGGEEGRGGGRDGDNQDEDETYSTKPLAFGGLVTSRVLDMTGS